MMRSSDGEAEEDIGAKVSPARSANDEGGIVYPATRAAWLAHFRATRRTGARHPPRSRHFVSLDEGDTGLAGGAIYDQRVIAGRERHEQRGIAAAGGQREGADRGHRRA